MTNLEAWQGRRIYLARMKIDEGFRDLKSLLGMARIMNKRQEYMEKMLALLLLVYAIGLLVGECLRDHLHGDVIGEEETVPEKERIPASPSRKEGKKWKRYSGLFILLKQKWRISSQDWQAFLSTALASFLSIVRSSLPT